MLCAYNDLRELIIIEIVTTTYFLIGIVWGHKSIIVYEIMEEIL